jgi:hypothetical protein
LWSANWPSKFDLVSYAPREQFNKGEKEMSWNVSGKSMELCNCKSLCPCWLGPDGEPDEGSCSAAFGFDVESGSSDGVDLSGCKVGFLAYWPGNFFAGNGSARLYIDESASPDQQRELEAIFSGKKGGLLEGLWGAVLSNWHPAGEASLKPFQDAAGNKATLSGAAAMAAFQMESMVLANGTTSNFSDPDLGDWQGDSGTLHRFDWAA